MTRKGFSMESSLTLRPTHLQTNMMKRFFMRKGKALKRYASYFIAFDKSDIFALVTPRSTCLFPSTCKVYMFCKLTGLLSFPFAYN